MAKDGSDPRAGRKAKKPRKRERREEKKVEEEEEVSEEEVSEEEVSEGEDQGQDSGVIPGGGEEEHDQTEEENEQTEDDHQEDDQVISGATFASLGVCPALCTAAASLGWATATRIQRDAVKPALQGRDVIGLAETGSGKTGAFVLPVLHSLLSDPPPAGTVSAVILAPTRELAFQIHEVVVALGTPVGCRACCVVGGIDMAGQAIALARSPHVVTATPGRLLDHLQRTRGFHLRRIRYLVLDEADRMLSMDFERELNDILDVLPDSTKGRRTMLFSATMTSKVQKLERASLSDPVRIEVSTKFQTPKKLLQSYLFIPARYKDVYLTYLVNENAGKSVLVFGATCNNVQRLALMLRNLGLPAVALHGQMAQPRRLGALAKFKSGDRNILLCTDVASRGLDIPSVDVVINYDLPGHGKDYIHRVGRTARAGRAGTAVAMVTQYDVEVYQRLEGLLGQKLPECRLDEETVLILHERVSEAQRLATRELKEQLSASSSNWGGRRGRQRGGGGDDDEGGVEGQVRRELKRGYAGGSSGKGGGYHNQRGAGKARQKKRRY